MKEKSLNDENVIKFLQDFLKIKHDMDDRRIWMKKIT